MFGLNLGLHSTHRHPGVVPEALQGSPEREYFIAFGVYPPIIPIDLTIEGLEGQIDETKRLAERTPNLDEASRFVHEIGYLTLVNERLKIEQLRKDREMRI